ncbi:hypothetical protein XBO1_2270016 [Xenorhabdus bovienii str. oregonense]|uniref:Uncharacterized protein n=1 Tax=Xenorhabdus bovienii str. oregonense TaxID=1398202 RepID=A0A077P5N8_XENBV|nr:hypothetical protein XBO1_2270016 [Xenorhabdus bovienii str. oregonense]
MSYSFLISEWIKKYLYHRSTWAETDFCYLEDLFVSPGVSVFTIGLLKNRA